MAGNQRIAARVASGRIGEHLADSLIEERQYGAAGIAFHA